MSQFLDNHPCTGSCWYGPGMICTSCGLSQVEIESWGAMTQEQKDSAAAKAAERRHVSRAQDSKANPLPASQEAPTKESEQ